MADKGTPQDALWHDDPQLPSLIECFELELFRHECAISGSDSQ
jgi:hypothetical protein